MRVKINGLQVGFKGVPKEWLQNLCDWLGIDLLILPTHSFDKQAVDCGCVWYVWNQISELLSRMQNINFQTS